MSISQSTDRAGRPGIVRLPPITTSFVGRDEEIAEASTILAGPDVRILTLTGTGGIGKTRLSLAIATAVVDTFPDGVVWVPLASTRDPALVIPTIARRLNLPEGLTWTAINGLIAYLQQRAMLLLLDNLEQVIEAAPELSRLLCECPTVKLIATSRLPLEIDGESVFSVPPFSVPEPGLAAADTIARHPAVELFIDRARTARPDFAPSADERMTIAEICRQVDGLPLAIELAAARAHALSPAEMLARLQNRERPATDREITVRDTVVWSYGLLDDTQQQLLRHLAVFTGGIAPETADELASDLGIDHAVAVRELIDVGMLRRVDRPGEPVRLRLLEMVREIALNLLDASDELDSARNWHARYFARLARDAEFALVGGEQREWFDRLEREQTNVRAALRWILETGDAELGLTIGAGVWRFWEQRGFVREGRPLLEHVVGMPAGQTPADIRASALFGLGRLHYQLGEFDAAQARFEELRSIATERGLDSWLAAAYTQLAHLATHDVDYLRARDLIEQSLAIRRRLDDQRGIAISLLVLGRNAHYLGDDDRATRLVDEGIAILGTIGDQHMLAGGYVDLGKFALARGTFALARGHLEEAVAIHQALGDQLAVAETLTLLGYVAIGQRNFAGARSLFTRSLTRLIELGARWRADAALDGLAEVALAIGDPATAVSILAAVERMRFEMSATLASDARERHDRNLAIARAALSDDEFQAAWQAGQTLSTEEIGASATPANRRS